MHKVHVEPLLVRIQQRTRQGGAYIGGCIPEFDKMPAVTGAPGIFSSGMCVDCTAGVQDICMEFALAL